MACQVMSGHGTHDQARPDHAMTCQVMSGHGTHDQARQGQTMPLHAMAMPGLKFFFNI